MSIVQHAGKRHNIKIDKVQIIENNFNKSKNSIHEEIKSKLKSENSCYHSLQNRLFSSFLFKNINIEIQRKIMFSCRFIRV